MMNILKIIQNVFSNLSSKPDVKQVDLRNCYEIYTIYEGNAFLSFVFNEVPVNSIWTIEGSIGNEAKQCLKEFECGDQEKVYITSHWPYKQPFRIMLCEPAREIIMKNMTKWKLGERFYHQHVYFQGHFYFTAYDGLANGSVWLTNRISKSKVDELKEKKIIDSFTIYEDGNER